MATVARTAKPYVAAAGPPAAVITATHPSVAARNTPTQASTRSRRTRSAIVARNGASSAAGAMRAAVTAPTAATPPSRNATTPSATMNALSLAHIAANEIWARRSGPLCATWPSAAAQSRNLGEKRAITTRLSQSAPTPARESRTPAWAGRNHPGGVMPEHPSSATVVPWTRLGRCPTARHAEWKEPLRSWRSRRSESRRRLQRPCARRAPLCDTDRCIRLLTRLPSTERGYPSITRGRSRDRMNVTIIGTGNMARGIGSRLLAGGHHVTVLAEQPADAEEVLKDLGAKGSAKAGSVRRRDLRRGSHARRYYLDAQAALTSTATHCPGRS